MVSQSLGVWLLSLIRGPFLMDFIRSCLSFCLLFRGSTFRGTDLLALAGNPISALQFGHCREVVPISESV